MKSLPNRLRALTPEILSGLIHGIEKESLRVEADGTLAKTPHPAQLGSALTHPSITTDFSEAQIEMVTGVHRSIEDCLSELRQLHQAVYAGIEPELLWATSMPCRLPADDEIPIGNYGSSNIGRLKTVYRYGLAHRYGRRMQTISGVHYNFSLPEAAWPLLAKVENDARPTVEFQNDSYLSLIRNFRRHSWLLLYLFGASPAVCGSFVAGRTHALQPLGPGSMYLPHGTSMRMGPLGYQSDAQQSLVVSYNDLAGYARTLTHGLTQPYPPYVDIGVLEAEGYRQLNTTLLQIENEFYGTIRPKRRINSGERPLHALQERGIEYVEVRCLDIDPFSPIGVASETARTIDIFLLHCLLCESPPDSPESIRIDAANQLAAAEKGRQTGLMLTQADGGQTPLRDWGLDILSECQPIAQALDEANGSTEFSRALAMAMDKLREPQQTPSAMVLATMKRDWGDSYQRFALDRSSTHRGAVLEMAMDPDQRSNYGKLADESIVKQAEIEAQDTIDFESFRQAYVAQELCPTEQL